ncbi:GerMN domain-containing protein [Glutamicibacter sp. PS]|uniref:GerMN domain-containing protein n=1 Tax=Glutamicibacter sp. PS TaxID=3075634 RepID=UPI00283C0CC0|nr:GerMN domain-containing protein [Glutamicibacter sp. PS]MDR4532777.1 GerMN domain-containing protein [Glutamicibacter sp. PS]
MQFKVRKSGVMRQRIACLAVAAVALTGCASTQNSTELQMPTADPAQANGLPVAEDTVESGTKAQSLPVYWLQNTDQGVFLYREYVKGDASAEPVTEAVRYLLNDAPATDRWYTLLEPSTEIGVAVGHDNVITLDLPATVFTARIDDGLAERSIQQLVFTATAAASHASLLTGTAAPRVRLLVDGQPEATVFGDYQLPATIERDPRFTAPLWIIDPQYGSVKAVGNVRINGRTAGFSGGTHYSLTRLDTASGDHNIIPATRVDQALIADDGSFSIRQRLEKGRYRLTLWGQNQGSMAQVATVTSDFTVGAKSED